MRQNTLNSVGVYNRCKLTRLVVDTEWDKKVFNDNRSVKAAKEKANFLAEEGKDTIELDPEERGDKRQEEKEIHPLPVELSGGIRL